MLAVDAHAQQHRRQNVARSQAQTSSGRELGAARKTRCGQVVDRIDGRQRDPPTAVGGALNDGIMWRSPVGDASGTATLSVLVSATRNSLVINTAGCVWMALHQPLRKGVPTDWRNRCTGVMRPPWIYLDRDWRAECEL
jgi:hypothetical protein